MRLSSLLFLGSNLALGYAASVQLVNPPNEVKLNDRKHPISVAYEGVNGEVRACVPCAFAWTWVCVGRGRHWVGRFGGGKDGPMDGPGGTPDGSSTY